MSPLLQWMFVLANAQKCRCERCGVYNCVGEIIGLNKLLKNFWQSVWSLKLLLASRDFTYHTVAKEVYFAILVQAAHRSFLSDVIEKMRVSSRFR